VIIEWDNNIDSSWNFAFRNAPHSRSRARCGPFAHWRYGGGLKALLLFTHSDSQLTAARLRTWADMVARCFCEWTPTVSGTSGISV